MPVRLVASAVATGAATIAAASSAARPSIDENNEDERGHHHNDAVDGGILSEGGNECSVDDDEPRCAETTSELIGNNDLSNSEVSEASGASTDSENAAVRGVFMPPPAAWFDQIENNEHRDTIVEGGAPDDMSGPTRTASTSDHELVRQQEDPYIEDECAAYDSSFGGHGDSDTDDNDSDDEQDDINNISEERGLSNAVIYDSQSPATTTTAPSTAALTAATTSCITASTTSATTAAIQSIRYTGQVIASSTSYHVTTTLPLAAGELVTSSLQRVVHTAKLAYSNRTWVGQYRQHSDLASGVGGYYRDDVVWDIGKELLGGEGAAGGADAREGSRQGQQQRSNDPHIALPPFSSLPWIDRQLVKEWRTYDLSNLVNLAVSEGSVESKASPVDTTAVQDGPPALTDDSSSSEEDNPDDDDHDYVSARTLIPAPLTRPPRENAKTCHYCDRPFGPTLHRHHCRLCGRSCCRPHSDSTHRLPHLGYDPNVAERVCFRCKSILEERNLAERIAWRLARLRDYFGKELVPYFVTGVDTMEDVAVRLTKAAIAMARRIPLGAQATVAVETLEVLRKHGLKGVYGLILRKEFMAAADLLCQACGINRKVWPLSVHELSAAIFYALAHHRMVRGMDPEGEHRIHALKGHKKGYDSIVGSENLLEEEDDRGALPTWADIAGVPQNANIGALSTVDEEGEIIVEDGGEVVGSKTNALLDDADVSDPSDNGEHGPFGASSEDNDDQSPDDILGEALPQRRIRPLVPVCDPAPDSLIASLLFYAPLALNFIYAASEVDMQLLAAQQGWRLLYAHLDQSGGCHASTSSRTPSAPETTTPIIEEGDKEKKLVADRPAFALLARPDQKLACLAIRGTATINDVVTDIRAVPVPFPPEDEAGGRHDKKRDCNESKADEADWTSVSSAQGLALIGMARAAINLYRENIDALTVLAKRGYRIRIVGHSLGGGVAALLGTLVRRHLEVVFEDDNGSSRVSLDDALRVYGYGTPACADAGLADETASYVTSCVLHDDVVPRLTATSIRGLLKHLLYVRETWVKDHLSADISAYAERAKGAWAPRWRQSFTLIKSTSKKQIGKAKKVYQEYKESVKTTSTGSDDIDLRDNSFDKVEESEMRIGPSRSVPPKDTALSDVPEANADTLEIDGDLFYEAEEDMIESDEEEGMVIDLGEMEQGEATSPKSEDATMSEQKQEKQDDTTPAVMLEETPLPRMYIPGKIVHIYTYRGAYKATQVPRKFRELRHISLAGNMLSDHLARQYYEALLEVKSVRRAMNPLPEWTGFGEESTCACCASRFTWASTSDTEAQEARDKHNCRTCGGLVCNPCSQNRLPLPDLGITLPSRVCDRCYHDMGGVMADGEEGEAMTRSYIAEEATENDGEPLAKVDSGRSLGAASADGASANSSRQRRSVVVDELASRIPSISDTLG